MPAREGYVTRWNMALFQLHFVEQVTQRKSGQLSKEKITQTD